MMFNPLFRQTMAITAKMNVYIFIYYRKLDFLDTAYLLRIECESKH